MSSAFSKLMFSYKLNITVLRLEIPYRVEDYGAQGNNGVLLSKNQDKTTGYSIDKLQDRGSFFVDPGEDVYAGQIIAENIKPGDLVVNATEGKKLTNHRASGSDDATRIAPKILLTLEECMEYIQQDECIEVTPNFIRMRKVILNEDDRKKVQKKMESAAA
jgi:GTP-binding protein